MPGQSQFCRIPGRAPDKLDSANQNTRPTIKGGWQQCKNLVNGYKFRSAATSGIELDILPGDAAKELEFDVPREKM